MMGKKKHAESDTSKNSLLKWRGSASRGNVRMHEEAIVKGQNCQVVLEKLHLASATQITKEPSIVRSETKTTEATSKKRRNSTVLKGSSKKLKLNDEVQDASKSKVEAEPKHILDIAESVKIAARSTHQQKYVERNESGFVRKRSKSKNNRPVNSKHKNDSDNGSNFMFSGNALQILQQLQNSGLWSVLKKIDEQIQTHKSSDGKEPKRKTISSSESESDAYVSSPETGVQKLQLHVVEKWNQEEEQRHGAWGPRKTENKVVSSQINGYLSPAQTGEEKSPQKLYRSLLHNKANVSMPIHRKAAPKSVKCSKNMNGFEEQLEEHFQQGSSSLSEKSEKCMNNKLNGVAKRNQLRKMTKMPAKNRGPLLKGASKPCQVNQTESASNIMSPPVAKKVERKARSRICQRLSSDGASSRSSILSETSTDEKEEICMLPCRRRFSGKQVFSSSSSDVERDVLSHRSISSSSESLVEEANISCVEHQKSTNNDHPLLQNATEKTNQCSSDKLSANCELSVHASVDDFKTKSAKKRCLNLRRTLSTCASEIVSDTLDRTPQSHTPDRVANMRSENSPLDENVKSRNSAFRVMRLHSETPEKVTVKNKHSSSEKAQSLSYPSVDNMSLKRSHSFESVRSGHSPSVQKVRSRRSPSVEKARSRSSSSNENSKSRRSSSNENSRSRSSPSNENSRSRHSPSLEKVRPGSSSPSENSRSRRFSSNENSRSRSSPSVGKTRSRSSSPNENSRSRRSPSVGKARSRSSSANKNSRSRRSPSVGKARSTSSSSNKNSRSRRSPSAGKARSRSSSANENSRSRRSPSVERARSTSSSSNENSRSRRSPSLEKVRPGSSSPNENSRSRRSPSLEKVRPGSSSPNENSRSRRSPSLEKVRPGSSSPNENSRSRRSPSLEKVRPGSSSPNENSRSRRSPSLEQVRPGSSSPNENLRSRRSPSLEKVRPGSSSPNENSRSRRSPSLEKVRPGSSSPNENSRSRRSPSLEQVRPGSSSPNENSRSRRSPSLEKVRPGSSSSNENSRSRRSPSVEKARSRSSSSNENSRSRRSPSVQKARSRSSSPNENSRSRRSPSVGKARSRSSSSNENSRSRRSPSLEKVRLGSSSPNGNSRSRRSPSVGKARSRSSSSNENSRSKRSPSLEKARSRSSSSNENSRSRRSPSLEKVRPESTPEVETSVNAPNSTYDTVGNTEMSSPEKSMAKANLSTSVNVISSSVNSGNTAGSDNRTVNRVARENVVEYSVVQDNVVRSNHTRETASSSLPEDEGFCLFKKPFPLVSKSVQETKLSKGTTVASSPGETTSRRRRTWQKERVSAASDEDDDDCDVLSIFAESDFGDEVELRPCKIECLDEEEDAQCMSPVSFIEFPSSPSHQQATSIEQNAPPFETMCHVNIGIENEPVHNRLFVIEYGHSSILPSNVTQQSINMNTYFKGYCYKFLKQDCTKNNCHFSHSFPYVELEWESEMLITVLKHARRKHYNKFVTHICEELFRKAQSEKQWFTCFGFLLKLQFLPEEIARLMEVSVMQCDPNSMQQLLHSCATIVQIHPPFVHIFIHFWKYFYHHLMRSVGLNTVVIEKLLVHCIHHEVDDFFMKCYSVLRGLPAALVHKISEELLQQFYSKLEGQLTVALSNAEGGSLSNIGSDAGPSTRALPSQPVAPSCSVPAVRKWLSSHEAVSATDGTTVSRPPLPVVSGCEAVSATDGTTISRPPLPVVSGCEAVSATIGTTVSRPSQPAAPSRSVCAVQNRSTGDGSKPKVAPGSQKWSAHNNITAAKSGVEPVKLKRAQYPKPPSDNVVPPDFQNNYKIKMGQWQSNIPHALPNSAELSKDAESDKEELQKCIGLEDHEVTLTILDKWADRALSSADAHKVFTDLQIIFWSTDIAFFQLLKTSGYKVNPLRKKVMANLGMNKILQYMQQEQWSEAFDIYKWMQENGICIEETQVIDKLKTPCMRILSCAEICIRSGKLTEAVKLLRSKNLLTMDKNQWKVEGSAEDMKTLRVMWSHILEMLVKRDLEKAFDQFRELKEHQEELDSYLIMCGVAILVEMLQVRRNEKAIHLFTMIEESSYNCLDTPTVRMLLVVLVQMNKERAARSLFYRATMMGNYPHIKTEGNTKCARIWSYMTKEEMILAVKHLLDEIYNETNGSPNLFRKYQAKIIIQMKELQNFKHKYFYLKTTMNTQIEAQKRVLMALTSIHPPVIVGQSYDDCIILDSTYVQEYLVHIKKLRQH